MTLKVVHRQEKLAPKSGVKFKALISGACVRDLRMQTDTGVKIKLFNMPSSDNVLNANILTNNDC